MSKPTAAYKASIIKFTQETDRHASEGGFVREAGDGREEACLAFVQSQGDKTRNDPDGVLAAVDAFASKESFMMNVGDEKGLILDDAVRRARPLRVLELGTYCGYSAVRMARLLPPNAKVVSVEFSAYNASVARRLIEHAGVSSRVTVVEGYISDGGKTLERVARELEGRPADFVFLDHAKEVYLSDLLRLAGRGLLRKGTVVVADNVLFPGAPEYRAFMQRRTDVFATREHHAHVEYQNKIKDMVLESVVVADNARDALSGEPIVDLLQKPMPSKPSGPKPTSSKM